MDITRRGFIKGATLSAVIPTSALLQGCNNDTGNNETPNTQAPSASSGQAQPAEQQLAVEFPGVDVATDVALDSEFIHGIASGDPLSDRVILWTRVTVSSDIVRQLADRSIVVTWQMSLSANFDQIDVEGRTITSEKTDFTVKVDATGLNPGTHYYYRFIVQDVTSPIGRTKTLPDGDVESLNIAMASCSHYMFGYFNVYSRIAEIDDLDVVLHLGDYIYEYGNDDAYRNPFLFDRRHEPAHEMNSLSDYRIRHAQYKRDTDSLKLHATHPMICIWDDHEFADNTWSGGAKNHTDGVEGVWADRSQAAIQAYYEWLPIREPGFAPQRNARDQLYRSFRFGNLLDLAMLDTRFIGRDKQCEFDGTELDPEHTLLGKDQEQWLYDTLDKAQQEDVTWKMLGQQVQMMQLRAFGQYVNSDSWDGYQVARNRLLDFVDDHDIDNLVILTGDIHSSWAANICKDPYDGAYNKRTGAGSKAVEFVTPSVSSPTLPIPALQQTVGDLAKVLRLENPHVKYIDFKNRGFVHMHITKDQVKAAWHHVPVVGLRTKSSYIDRTFLVKNGDPRLIKA